MKYTIYAVDRAGNSHEAWTTDHAQDALQLVQMERECRGPLMISGTAWLCDNETGEPCEGRLEELCS